MKTILSIVQGGTSLIVMSIIGFWLVPQAFAQPETEKILMLLKGYEWQLQPKQFQFLGKGTDIVLMEIASDTSLMNAYRFRALQVLTLFQNEQVADFLEKYMEKYPSSSHLRRAFEAFSEGFGQTQPTRVLAAAQKLLNHANPHVRISAARALRTLNTSGARTAYRGQLRQEEAWVREAIQK